MPSLANNYWFIAPMTFQKTKIAINKKSKQVKKKKYYVVAKKKSKFFELTISLRVF